MAASLPDGEVSWRIAIAGQNPLVAYAGTGRFFQPGQIWRTVNGGGAWEHAGDCGPALPRLNTCQPVMDPNDPDTVYAVVEGVGIGGGGDIIRRTIDGGLTWTTLGLPALSVSLTVLPTIPSTLLAQVYDPTDAGRYVLVMSTDRGEHWTPSNAGLPHNAEISGIVFDPRDPTHLFAGTQGRGVFRSVDGGVTWEPTGLTR